MLSFPFSIFFHVRDAWRSSDESRAAALAERREAPEYLPAGTPIPVDSANRALASHILLPSMPPALVAPPASVVAEDRAAGELDVAISSPEASTVVVRRFFFPHWRVEAEDGSEVITRFTI